MRQLRMRSLKGTGTVLVLILGVGMFFSGVVSVVHAQAPRRINLNQYVTFPGSQYWAAPQFSYNSDGVATGASFAVYGQNSQPVPGAFGRLEGIQSTGLADGRPVYPLAAMNPDMTMSIVQGNNTLVPPTQVNIGRAQDALPFPRRDQPPQNPPGQGQNPPGGGQGAAPAGNPVGEGAEGQGGPLVPCVNACRIQQLLDLGRNVFNFLMGLAAIAAVAAIIVAGFRYVSARGDPAALSDAKQKLTYAILGFLILLFAVVIVNTILRALEFRGGGGGQVDVPRPGGGGLPGGNDAPARRGRQIRLGDDFNDLDRRNPPWIAQLRDGFVVITDPSALDNPENLQPLDLGETSRIVRAIQQNGKLNDLNIVRLWDPNIPFTPRTFEMELMADDLRNAGFVPYERNRPLPFLGY